MKKNPRGEKKVKKKVVYKPDDGRTLYDMSCLDAARGIKNDGGDEKLTKKERKAAIKAAFAHYLPPIIITIVCFTIVAIAMYLWLMN